MLSQEKHLNSWQPRAYALFVYRLLRSPSALDARRGSLDRVRVAPDLYDSVCFLYIYIIAQACAVASSFFGVVYSNFDLSP